MSRIALVDPATAEGDTKTKLDAIGKKLGFVPNVMRTLANSPAAFGMYVNNTEALRQGELSQRLREQIALAVGQLNNCKYCVAAHTAIARRLRIDDEELALNLAATSADPKIRAALEFAKRIVETRGGVSDRDVERVGEAGYSNRQIVELVAIVSHNMFTNFINHVAETEIDFPDPNLKPGVAA